MARGSVGRTGVVAGSLLESEHQGVHQQGPVPDSRHGARGGMESAEPICAQPFTILAMTATPKADPANYRKLRDHMLRSKQPGFEPDAVEAVLMDWNLGNGTATVLAAADGSASVDLSSGGGYIGGGQKYRAIRNAALHAVQIAASLLSQFKSTETIDLPSSGAVFFYLKTNSELRLAATKEANLSAGTDPLAALAAMMQEIITQYRLNFPRPPTK